MKQQLYYTNFAQAYGEGTYSACTYNDAQSCASTGGGSTGGTGTGSSSGGGGLANTGFDVLLVVTLACVLIFAGLMMRIMRKKKHLQQPTSPTTPSQPQTPDQHQ